MSLIVILVSKINSMDKVGGTVAQILFIGKSEFFVIDCTKLHLSK